MLAIVSVIYLQQHKGMMSPWSTSKVRVDSAGFSAPGHTRPKSRCWRAWALTQSLQGESASSRFRWLVELSPCSYGLSSPFQAGWPWRWLSAQRGHPHSRPVAPFFFKARSIGSRPFHVSDLSDPLLLLICPTPARESSLL